MRNSNSSCHLYFATLFNMGALPTQAPLSACFISEAFSSSNTPYTFYCFFFLLSAFPHKNKSSGGQEFCLFIQLSACHSINSVE